ncbi:MAG: energy transducer TonB [Myxococcota bacterium]
MKIYVVTIVVSVLAHWALVGGLSKAAREAPKPARVIEMAVVTPPPPAPEVVPEPPKPVEEKAKRPPKPVDVPVAAKPEEPPPANEQKPAEEPPQPVFGISMSSTVSGNSGFSVRVGNTTMKEPEKDRTDPRDVKPYAGGAPNIVPVHSLSQPPMPKGACPREFPPAARAAGVNGSIKLELLILEDGTVGEARPLNDLGYGTAEAAVRAMKKCAFTPGSDGSKPVRTLIIYKYTFNYEGDD